MRRRNRQGDAETNCKRRNKTKGTAKQEEEGGNLGNLTMQRPSVHTGTYRIREPDHAQ